MYNRYIPNGASYTRVTVDEPVESSPGASQAREPHQKARPGDQRSQHTGRPGSGGPAGFSLPSFLTGEGGSGGLGGLLKALKLEDLDSGDLLLLLIVLLLLWEGDDLELVIALGLVLILGLGDEPEEEADGR